MQLDPKFTELKKNDVALFPLFIMVKGTFCDVLQPLRLPPMILTEGTSCGLWPPDLLTNALRPSFGIAMLTGFRHLRAAPPRVEGMRCPLDL